MIVGRGAVEGIKSIGESWLLLRAELISNGECKSCVALHCGCSCREEQR